MKLLLQIADHLQVFSDFGVDGVSQNPAWRAIPVRSIGSETEKGGVFTRRQSEIPIVTRQEYSQSETLSQIRETLGDCRRCKLHEQRKNIVFGVGNPEADLMFVGEAPGRDEDIKGLPFVGRAGMLLTKIIESTGLTRDQVYIANVIKCRPPQNRNPEPIEVQTCEPFLFNQIDAIKPRVIVALGTFAARTLLGKEDKISRMRGQVYEYRGAKLIPTFHPAFLLRSPSRKRETWEDMKVVRTLLSNE